MSPKVTNDKVKQIKLFEYLQKIVQFNRKVVKDIITGYGSGNILWFSDIANASNCTIKEWSNTDNELLKVRHRCEPMQPSIPEEYSQWIDLSSDLKPELKKNIFEVTESGNSEKELASYLRVKSVFDEYIKKHWEPWKKEHDKWEEEEKCYQKLFRIYQTLNKSKEQYELILGLGLLQYKNRSADVITRHLLVLKMEAELRAEKAELILRFPSDTALFPEFEILKDEISKDIEDKVKKLLNEDSSFTQENFDKILKTILNTAFGTGEYSSAFECVHEVTEKPIITFSPAIILRERSSIGLKKTLEDITTQLKNDVKVSSLFEELMNIGEKDDCVDFVSGSGHKENEKVYPDISELFFPKPYNEAQEKIVHRITYANGVVVQGPPGTGKSHTIANLICHLLATGNRILVTAKTPTALKVLREKIPDPLKNLAISVLGNSAEEQKILEGSVQSILNASNIWNDKKINHQLNIITQKLDQLRREKAKKDRQLREILESEVHTQSVAEGRYKGTASKIVKKINEEYENYSWFKDKIALDTCFSLSVTQLLEILDGMRKFYDIRDELSKDLGDSVSSEDFENLVDELDVVSDSELEKLRNNSLSSYCMLYKPSIADLISISQKIRKFENKKEKVLLCNNEDWVKFELDKISKGIESNYDEILEKVNACLKEAKVVEDIAVNYRVEYPQELTFKGVYEDAKTLKKYKEEGNSLSALNLLMPQNVRKCTYIFQKVKINSRYCKRIVEDLNILIDFSKYHYNIKVIKDLLGEFIEIPKDITLRKIGKIINVLENISEINALFSSVKKADIFRHLKMTTRDLNSIRQTCNYAAISELEKQLRAIIDKNNAHPVVSELLTAVTQRNKAEYYRAKMDLDNLFKIRDEFWKMQRSISKLEAKIPLTIDEMARSYKDEVWESRLKERLEGAWYWSQAKNWVENYINQDNLPKIKEYLNNIEDQIKENIGELAKLKSWSFCISRLTPEQKKHAELWKQALKKLGKGTGKYANKWRKSAQEHLNGCREAVPAWIMPLYNVWDNLAAAPALFDVIIVDEASQCGIDSLPLFYFAKKILIVGDDKQISPENVGFDRSQTNQLMRAYLSDFGSFKDCFDCDNSLFDVGNAIFNSSQIVLREHFRCMPEIIKFSNDLCYSNTPLIPLKQYGTDRLPPLENVFVAEGYREGKGEKAINRPETDAIVNRIEQICTDEKYDNKSIGVIVLQGKAQAELIQSQLSQRLSTEQYEAHEIICGVPSQFQGNEKDIILLSMVAAPNVQFTALTRKADEQRFNVAMSRAKEQVILFHSVKISDLNTSCLRRRLLEFFDHKKINDVNGISKEELEKVAYQSIGKRNDTKTPKGFDSWFEVDVALEIMHKGYQILSQYEVAGKRIDIVVLGGSARLAVECDGDHWHNQDNYEDDMLRQSVLERCGWEFFRVRESAFYYNKEQSLQRLWEILNEKGIEPRNIP